MGFLSKKADELPSKKKKPRIGCIGGILFILFLGFVGSKMAPNQAPHNTPQPAVQLTEDEKTAIEKEAKKRAQQSLEDDLTVKAKKRVSALMKYPDSTKFKNVFFNKTTKGGDVICGNYDSKNSFGAYSGYKRFISNGTTTFFEERDKNIADVWVETCLKEK